MSQSDIEVVPNPERGCGYLKEGKAYLRGVVSPDGVLPPFVEFDEPIPFLEGHIRGYSYFPGVQFELTVTPGPEDYAAAGQPPGAAVNDPKAARDRRDQLDELRDAEIQGAGWRTRADPPLEVYRHLERIQHDAEMGTTGRGHIGEMRVARSHDLLMWVGETHYSDPEAFIDECRQHGLSKAIPVSDGQSPPVINPGRTRVFLIHPTAVHAGEDDDGEPKHVPGIIGYAYVTRIIYTGTEVGGEVEFPEWAQEYAESGHFDLVRVGARQPAENVEHGGGLEQWSDEETEPEPTEGPQDDAEPVPADRDAAVQTVIGEMGFHAMRRLAAEHDLDVGRNPSADDLAEAIVDAGLDGEEVPEVDVT